MAVRRPIVNISGVKEELPVGDSLPGALASGYIEITASTTWTVPTDATWVYAEIVAGGGSGAVHTSSIAQGGAGGECVFKLYRAADLPSGVTVVIGAGGAAKSGGVSSHGANGGNSSFNGLMAYGGLGGLSGSANLSTSARPTGYTSYAADTETKFIPKPNYGPSQCPTVHGGAGGGLGSNATTGTSGTSIHHGNGGNGYGVADDLSTATAGGFPGGGGGGRGNTSSVAGRTSGAGANGVVRVWYW